MFPKFAFLFLMFPLLGRADSASMPFGTVEGSAENCTNSFQGYWGTMSLPLVRTTSYSTDGSPQTAFRVLGVSPGTISYGGRPMVCVQFNPPDLGSYAAWVDAHYGYNDQYVASVYVTGTAVARGSINPKYVVLSVLYAPPGPQSNVDYGTSTVMGTCNSWESSFSSNTTLTKSFTVKIPVFGSLDSKVSSSWTETSDASSSICVNKSTASDILVRGPLDPNAGIDHNYDVVRLWVNPQANFTATTPNSAQWSFSFDQRDP